MNIFIFHLFNISPRMAFFRLKRETKLPECTSRSNLWIVPFHCMHLLLFRVPVFPSCSAYDLYAAIIRKAVFEISEFVGYQLYQVFDGYFC